MCVCVRLRRSARNTTTVEEGRFDRSLRLRSRSEKRGLVFTDK